MVVLPFAIGKKEIARAVKRYRRCEWQKIYYIYIYKYYIMLYYMVRPSRFGWWKARLKKRKNGYITHITLTVNAKKNRSWSCTVRTLSSVVGCTFCSPMYVRMYLYYWCLVAIRAITIKITIIIFILFLPNCSFFVTLCDIHCNSLSDRLFLVSISGILH